MKQKMASLLLVWALVVAMTGCASTQNNPTAPSSEPAITPRFASSSESATAQPDLTRERGERLLTVELDFQRSGTLASNQYAVWIENDAGELVKTLYVSQFTAGGGYVQREDSIPTWVAKVAPGQMEDAGIEAIAGATPQSGVQSYRWDGTDETGAAVPDGEYHIYVEGTLYWTSRVLFSGTFHWGGESGHIEMTPVYTEPENDQNRDMLTQVSAEYAAAAEQSASDVAAEAQSAPDTPVPQPMNDLGAFSPQAALEYMKTTDDLVIVDVATTSWYQENHFAGAVHIPIEELDSAEEDALYGELPAGRPVLVHCRRGVIAPGAYRHLKELRPDIPEISYIDGAPLFDEYNDWKSGEEEEPVQKLLGGQSPDDALEYMKNTPDLVIVEVNAPEWKLSNGISGAMWIPYTEMVERYDEIPAGRPVLLHCGGGIVSVEAYEILQEKRPDIPELSYIAGAPPVRAYNEWLTNQ